MVTSQTVALKIFGGDAGLAGDGKRRDRLLREARAASRSRHPHVLAIDDLLDLEDGRAALVMPLLVGESLRDRLSRERKLTAAQVRGLFAPALEGLARAHDAGVIHRDLKPDNLFVTAEPARLVILDFGVAKISADGDLGLTSTGVTVGTPFYMAPEQLFGEDDVDARADLWALGVVLFECLKGERPTEAANLGQLLKRISAGKVARLAAEDVPGEPALVALVNAMLSVEREARPSLTEVRAALEPPIVPPSPDEALVGSVAPPAAPATEPAAAPPPLGRTGQRSPLLLGGLLVALGATALIARETTRADLPRGRRSATEATTPPPLASTSAPLGVAPPPSAAPEATASARPAPSATASPTRGALPTMAPPPASTPGVAVASASAKIVAAPPAGTVSSPPPPPRIVEQAPF